MKRFCLAAPLLLVVLAGLGLTGGCAAPAATGPYFTGENLMNSEKALIRRPGIRIVLLDKGIEFTSGKAFKPPFSCDINTTVPLPEDYVVWRECQKGYTHVKILRDGRPPLYGILVFHAMWKFSRGLATRSFELEIPDKYLDAAANGEISVVYELYSNDYGDRVAWELWMLNEPLW